MPEDSIVYELKRKLERERYHGLMSLSDDELRVMNSNERLGLENHPDLKLKSRSLDEKGYLQSWQYLDDLGAEYHELVKQGHGTLIEKRNARQREIADILVNRTIPYITKQVDRLVRGPGIEIFRYGERRIVRIKNCKTPLQDLVQEGVAVVIKKLHKYDSERANLATFIDHTIVTPIQRTVRRDIGVIVLPEGAVIRKARKIIEESADHNEAITRIMGEVKINGKTANGEVASALYYGIRRGYNNIDKLIESNLVFGRDTYRNYYLEDRSKNADVEQTASKNIVYTKMKAALAELPVREQEILLQRYKHEVTLQQIADKLGLSRERIRQLEAKALQRLRKKLVE